MNNEMTVISKDLIKRLRNRKIKLFFKRKGNLLAILISFLLTITLINLII